MPKRRDILDHIERAGIVAIVRATENTGLLNVARALKDGGIDIIEITFTVPRAEDVLREVKRELGDAVLLGAGTILDCETAHLAIRSGADFLVTPATKPEVIQLALRYDRVIIPGGFTPTEILMAWECGAELIKIFPAEIGGPALVKALRGPFPQIRFMPTGGVNLHTLESFFHAGAVAVGVGSALVDPCAVQQEDYDKIREQARRYRDLMSKIKMKHPSP